MSDPMHALLAATPLLDLHHPDIEALVARRGWRTLSPYPRIGAVYEFVRNGIAFGYGVGDELPASRVLADGIGQCNTKSTLLMALLRAFGIPCRFHGFMIDKPLQKGAITGLAYGLAPRRIIHSWVEVSLEGHWIALEGFFLDAPYLASCNVVFRRPAISAATAPPHPTCRRPASSGGAPRLQPLGPQALAVRAIHPPCDKPQRRACSRFQVVRPRDPLVLVGPRPTP